MSGISTVTVSIKPNIILSVSSEELLDHYGQRDSTQTSSPNSGIYYYIRWSMEEETLLTLAIKHPELYKCLELIK